MKKCILLFILTCICGVCGRAADVTNLQSALKDAAAYASPASAVTAKSPHIARFYTEPSGLQHAVIQSEGRRFAFHTRQMVFKNGVFLGNQEILPYAKNGFIHLVFNPARYRLHAVYSRTGNFDPQMPVMSGEVGQRFNGYDVSDVLITQYGSGAAQHTVFYFLVPLSAPPARA